MKKTISKPNDAGDKINRYNDTVYVKYDYCEFHPSMMLGSTSSCIPFCEHNQAPRNIYNFSQAKQGKGIFATNERHRMDISYRLANPSAPLVQTRGMRYLKTIDLPNGENIIVAIVTSTNTNCSLHHCSRRYRITTASIPRQNSLLIFSNAIISFHPLNSFNHLFNK